MATITGTIKQNGTAVGAGWTLVYGDSGSGIKTTDSNGQFTWDDVASSFKAALVFVVLDASGETKTGGAGTLIVAGQPVIFETY